MKNTNDTLSSALKKGMMLIVLTGVAAAPVSAQSLLKGLAGKAVQKVAGKVADKVGHKADAKPVATTPDSCQDEGYTSTASDDYPERLGPSVEYPGYWKFYINPEEVTPLAFKNYADVQKALPALPPAADMLSEEAMEKYYQSLIAFTGGLSALHMQRSALYAEMAYRGQNLKPTGVDDNTRDYMNQMAQVVMKLSPEEKLKIANLEDQGPEAMLGYLKTHHPDIYKLVNEKGKNIKPAASDIDEKRADQFAALADELEPIVGRMSEELVSAANPALKAETAAAPILQLRQELLEAWPKSPECAKIKAMQADLDARTDEWSKGGKNMDKFWDYPPFWDEERAKQNEIIDAYNLKGAERMRAAVQQAIDAALADLKVVADCDARLEALGAKNDGEAIFYANVLTRISAAAMSLHANLFSLPYEVLELPLVNHTMLSSEMGQ